MPITARTTAQRNSINAVVGAMHSLAELCDAIIDGGVGRADPAQDLLDLDARKTEVTTAIAANMGANYRVEVASKCASMVELAIAALEGDVLDNTPTLNLTSRKVSAAHFGEAVPLVSRSVCGR